MIDPLGDRMKTYEDVSKTRLIRRTPVILRLDGKSFSSFTTRKKYIKPFDYNLAHAMGVTAMLMVHQVQTAVFAYTQSDEISLLLKDYENLETEAWFGAQVQKMVSVAAATCSMIFSKQKAVSGKLEYDEQSPRFRC